MAVPGLVNPWRSGPAINAHFGKRRSTNLEEFDGLQD
jgi:hypothetical protein